MPRPVLLVWPVILFSFLCSSAQTAPAPVQRVEISAPTLNDQRRNDSSGRLTVSREDIVRFGDVNVSALLRRQPGIAVVNGEVRMRGMGSGYTQILIDGEPAPAGFTVDSLAPSMIERIDIMRNGSAEFGAQAIAGSINIIMRKNHARPQRELTLGAGSARGYLVAPSAALRWASQQGDVAWSLGMELARPNFHYAETAYETESDAAGRLVNERISRASGSSATNKIALSPRLNWKLGGGDSLAWQAVVERNRVHTAGCAAETLLKGAYTAYPDNCFGIDLMLKSVRSDVTWTRTIGPGKLVAKAGLNRNDRNADYLFTGAGSTATLARRVLSDALDHTTEVGGAGSVDDVDVGRHVAGFVGPLDRRALGENGDATLFFEVVRIHRALGDALIVSERAGLAEELIDERGLAMIDVRDDRNVAQAHAGILSDSVD